MTHRSGDGPTTEYRSIAVSFRLFEHDHGLTCHRCRRVIHKGQPYAADFPYRISGNGEPWSNLLCVYCAFPPVEP